MIDFNFNLFHLLSPLKWNKTVQSQNIHLDNHYELTKNFFNRNEKEQTVNNKLNLNNKPKDDIQKSYWEKTRNIISNIIRPPLKICDSQDQNYIDPNPDMIKFFDSIQDANAQDFSFWLATFLGNKITNLMNDGKLTSAVASIIRPERLKETVIVNLLQIIANALKIEDQKDPKDQIEGQNKHQKECKPIFEQKKAENASQECINLIIPLSENINQILPLNKGSIDSQHSSTETPKLNQNQKPNPMVKLVNVLRNCFLVDQEELEQIAALKKVAELQRRVAQAELTVYAMYDNITELPTFVPKEKPDALAKYVPESAEYNPELKEKVKRGALQPYLQEARQAYLNVLNNEWSGQKCTDEEKEVLVTIFLNRLLCSDKGQRDLYIREAKAELERIAEEIERQIENRKKLFAKKITPRVISTLLPGGKSDMRVYFPVFAIYLLEVYPAQELIWRTIQSKLPEIFLELFPFFFHEDRENQEALINANPHANLIREGIDLFSDDILNLAIEKLNIPENTNSIVREFIKPYFEYILMHAFNTFSRLDHYRFKQLIEMIGEIRSNMAKNANFKEADLQILQDGLTKIWGLLTEQEQNQLFGLPPMLAKFANKHIPRHGSTFLYKNLIRYLKGLNAQKIADVPNGFIAETSVKINALVTAIYNNLDVQIDKLVSNAKILDNGYSKMVKLMSEGLGKAIEKKKKSFAFAGFMGDLMQSGILNPLFRDTIDLAHTQEAYPLKFQLLEVLKPVLTNFALKGITPLLEKEKVGGREFDKNLIMPILTIIADYLKQRNKPVSNHQRESQTRADKIRAEYCYNDLKEKLIYLFFPNGLQDLEELFPELEEKELQSLFELTDKIPSLLATAKGSIFDMEIFRDICISIEENIIATFQETKPAASSTPRIEVALTAEEKAWQERLDVVLEELILEGAKLTDLPVNRLLKIASYLPGNQNLKQIIIKSTREAILKKMDGHLVEKQLKSALEKQQKKVKTNKPAGYYQEKLDRLERQLVVEGVLYGLRSASEFIHKALQSLDYPVIKQVKDALEALCRFFIVRIAGGLLRLSGLDEWLINKCYEILRRNRIKIQTEFAKPAEHEGVLVDAIQALIRVLES